MKIQGFIDELDSYSEIQSITKNRLRERKSHSKLQTLKRKKERCCKESKMFSNQFSEQTLLNQKIRALDGKPKKKKLKKLNEYTGLL